YGVMLLFVIPQLVYHFWLSAFTLLHHTSPDTHFMPAEAWDPVRAQLDSSIHVRFPAIIDWLTHDISWHVPHHVCSAIPHYRLRDAHAALNRALPGRVRQEPFSPAYLMRVLRSCQLVEKSEGGYLHWATFKDLRGKGL